MEFSFFYCRFFFRLFFIKPFFTTQETLVQISTFHRFKILESYHTGHSIFRRRDAKRLPRMCGSLMIFQKNLIVGFCLYLLLMKFITGHLINSVIQIPDHAYIIRITLTAEITIWIMTNLKTVCVFDQSLFCRTWSCSGVLVFTRILIFRKRSSDTLTRPSPPSRIRTMASKI